MKWLADENFRNAIVRGILRQAPVFDILRAQDIPRISGRDDLALLKFVTGEGRVVVTHDVSTMTRHAYDRCRSNLPMPGVIEVSRALPLGSVIEDLLLIAEQGARDDFEGQVRYLPLA